MAFTAKNKVRKLLQFSIVVCFAYCSTATYAASRQQRQFTPEKVVVSVRILQQKGRSHWHLYLYDGSGKLIRQLTTGKGWDNTDPVFSPDGHRIAFRRSRVSSNQSTQNEIYVIDSNGSNLRSNKSTSVSSEWLSSAIVPKRLENRISLWAHQAGDADGTSSPALQAATELTTQTFVSPDKKWALEIEPAVFNDTDDKDTLRSLFLKDCQTNTAASLNRLFENLEHTDRLISDENGNPWFQVDSHWVFFPITHMGSTDGQRFTVVSPDASTAVVLSQNSADVRFIPEMHGFLSICEQRYEPLGDGRNVNCLYLDWWTSNLKRTRYSGPLGILQSASIRLKSGTNIIIDSLTE